MIGSTDCAGHGMAGITPSPVARLTCPARIRNTGENVHHSQLDFHASVGRSAEFCPAHFTGQTLRMHQIERVNSPAPVETDRRPENAALSASFAVATAPSLLREGPPTHGLPRASRRRTDKGTS
jgi:hypothetical protein